MLSPVRSVPPTSIEPTEQSLTFNNNTANYTIGSNPIAGSAYVVKNGSALVTLAGGNSFSGGVTINGGTLIISASADVLPAGSVTVNSGGTFAAGYAINQAFLTQIAPSSAG